MAAVSLKEDLASGTGLPVPTALIGRSGKKVYIANRPAYQGSDGYDPHLQDMIAEAVPFACHVMERQVPASVEPLHLFYIDPKESLDFNVTRLVGFLRSLCGTKRTWLPLSSSHTMMMHTLLLSLPQLVGLDLSSLTLMHIGDNGQHPGLELLARNHGMGYCFHALY